MENTTLENVFFDREKFKISNNLTSGDNFLCILGLIMNICEIIQKLTIGVLTILFFILKPFLIRISFRSGIKCNT